jgi:hypothetical protein
MTYRIMSNPFPYVEPHRRRFSPLVAAIILLIGIAAGLSRWLGDYSRMTWIPNLATELLGLAGSVVIVDGILRWRERQNQNGIAEQVVVLPLMRHLDGVYTIILAYAHSDENGAKGVAYSRPHLVVAQRDLRNALRLYGARLSLTAINAIARIEFNVYKLLTAHEEESDVASIRSRAVFCVGQIVEGLDALLADCGCAKKHEPFVGQLRRWYENEKSR